MPRSLVSQAGSLTMGCVPVVDATYKKISFHGIWSSVVSVPNPKNLTAKTRVLAHFQF
jgi:hypothetical protein